nr:tryptophan halogenase family protein [Simiduia agarivorans]
MKTKVSKVVVLGGGTAGWMSAALLKKVLGDTVSIELVESEQIGAVGVGEATIPPIQLVNSVLGLNEAEFLRETNATIKLAIKFENWKQQGHSYFHTFGAPGKSTAFCHFHHYWTRANQAGHPSDLWDYDLNYQCAINGRFAHIKSQDPVFELPYAYHFDASLYAKFLRKISEAMGVSRTEGIVKDATLNSETGMVESLLLDDGRQVAGDFFIDCSGFRGLLIQSKCGAGYDDWSHLLPCNSAVAMPSERLPETLPYTRSIAHQAGWQWRIPLQHRNGNGMVYCSHYISDDEAIATLSANLDTAPLADPKIIRFTTGRTRKPWSRNVVAVGLSSGFLEPLESTSIHLIQSAVVRLIKLFPHNGIDAANVAEYNKQSEIEYLQVRDFLILHYFVNERQDSPFWRDMQQLDIPASLRHKIDLFESTGKLFREQEDLFAESSWLQVMLGQGITPRDYHPLANAPSEHKLLEMLANLRAVKAKPAAELPTHDEFLKSFCGR